MSKSTKYVALQRLRHPRTQKVIEPGDVFETDTLTPQYEGGREIPPHAVQEYAKSASLPLDTERSSLPSDFFSSEQGRALLDAAIEARLAARSTPPPAQPEQPKPEASEPPSDDAKAELEPSKAEQPTEPGRFPRRK